MYHPRRMKLVSILVVILCTGFSPSYARALISSAPLAGLNGAKVWADNCSRCHNFRAPTEYTPNQWDTIMLHMRIQGGLTGPEARAVLSYLTQASMSQFTTASVLSTPQQPSTTNQPVGLKGRTATSKSSGAAIYQKNCAACHGVNGKGVIPTAPDFTKKGGVLSQPSSVLLTTIKQGIRSMPPRGGNSALTDQDLDAVLNYIKTTF